MYSEQYCSRLLWLLKTIDVEHPDADPTVILLAMANSQGAVRRSGRRRQPNKKYTVDAFEGIEGLVGSDPEDQVTNKIDSDNDAEFSVDLDPEPQVDAEEEDDLSVDEGSAASATNESQNSNEDSSDDAESIIGSGNSTPKNGSNDHIIKTPTRRLVRSKTIENEAAVYIRGLEDLQRSGSKSTVMQSIFGKGPDDIIPHILAREKWANDTTLPSRFTSKGGAGGMHRSFYYTTEMQNREADEAWNWYYDQNGKDRIHKKQFVSSITLERAKLYVQSTAPAQTFMIGPRGEMKTLQQGESLDLSTAWLPQGSSSSSGGTAKSKASKRRGWIMNLGTTRVQCLDWVPSEQGSTQYLAVAIEQAGPFATHQPYESPTAPSFFPRAPTPASLQIWSFEAKPVSNEGSWSIDTASRPRLRLLLCTDWGDIKAFRWCPVLDKDKSKGVQSPSKRLGLLAGVWADGFLRVIDVFHSTDSEDTEYVHVDATPFEARPPNGVFTNITWLSAVDIAASTAHGSVAIFNIFDCINAPSARPWFFKPLADTYIFNLVSGYPSRPHILFTTSMSGHLRLTDLRAPESDSVESLRNRLGAPTIAWHEPSQCVVTCDEAPNLRLLAIRRFFAAMNITKLPAAAASSECLVTSPVHSSVLVGLVDGSVIANNPLRRVQGAKAPLFVQKWFQHEFSRATPRARELGGEAGGIVRFSDGFKVEPASARDNQKEIEKRRKAGETGFNPMTVYEEKSNVSALAWNPNIHCGGWAAAGMGSGLLRVEDIALDRSG